MAYREPYTACFIREEAVFASELARREQDVDHSLFLSMGLRFGVVSLWRLWRGERHLLASLDHNLFLSMTSYFLKMVYHIPYTVYRIPYTAYSIPYADCIRHTETAYDIP